MNRTVVVLVHVKQVPETKLSVPLESVDHEAEIGLAVQKRLVLAGRAVQKKFVPMGPAVQKKLLLARRVVQKKFVLMGPAVQKKHELTPLPS